ncbi:MAG: hypothetical protein OXS50_12600 [Gammaproteobacteria bacterium]|nr:hypothetical protein [Gammaproteobacteria bacterium]
MNRLHIAMARQPPVVILPPEAFARTPLPPTYAAAKSPEAVVDALIARHCAGMADRRNGSEVRAALLLGNPSQTPLDNPTIAWLLRTCTPPDALRLIARAQIPVPALAAYIRHLEINNPLVIRMLNQFAWPSVSAAD